MSLTNGGSTSVQGLAYGINIVYRFSGLDEIFDINLKMADQIDICFKFPVKKMQLWRINKCVK
jgi:hypothetical protein